MHVKGCTAYIRGHYFTPNPLEGMRSLDEIELAIARLNYCLKLQMPYLISSEGTFRDLDASLRRVTNDLFGSESMGMADFVRKDIENIKREIQTINKDLSHLKNGFKRSAGTLTYKEKSEQLGARRKELDWLMSLRFDRDDIRLSLVECFNDLLILRVSEIKALGPMSAGLVLKNLGWNQDLEKETKTPQEEVKTSTITGTFRDSLLLLSRTIKQPFHSISNFRKLGACPLKRSQAKRANILGNYLSSSLQNLMFFICLCIVTGFFGAAVITFLLVAFLCARTVARLGARIHPKIPILLLLAVIATCFSYFCLHSYRYLGLKKLETKTRLDLIAVKNSEGLPHSEEFQNAESALMEASLGRKKAQDFLPLTCLHYAIAALIVIPTALIYAPVGIVLCLIDVIIGLALRIFYKNPNIGIEIKPGDIENQDMTFFFGGVEHIPFLTPKESSQARD